MRTDLPRTYVKTAYKDKKGAEQQIVITKPARVSYEAREKRAILWQSRNNQRFVYQIVPSKAKELEELFLPYAKEGWIKAYSSLDTKTNTIFFAVKVIAPTPIKGKDNEEEMNKKLNEEYRKTQAITKKNFELDGVSFIENKHVRKHQKISDVKVRRWKMMRPFSKFVWYELNGLNKKD